jgi:hypothetical protein
MCQKNINILLYKAKKNKNNKIKGEKKTTMCGESCGPKDSFSFYRVSKKNV